ncbi:MAG: hypothetical protein ACYC09_07960 [Bacteroidota bacterium]
MNILLKQYRIKIIETFEEMLKDYGFDLTTKKMDKESCTIIFCKDKLYIRFSATTHPRDYPSNSFNIILGEGELDFPESDWNSIPLSAIKNYKQKNSIVSEYSLKYLDREIKKAKSDLLEFGLDFLKLKLKLFHDTRKYHNQQREPYKIYSPNNIGKYTEAVDSVSSKLKRKFS